MSTYPASTSPAASPSPRRRPKPGNLPAPPPPPLPASTRPPPTPTAMTLQARISSSPSKIRQIMSSRSGSGSPPPRFSPPSFKYAWAEVSSGRLQVSFLRFVNKSRCSVFCFFFVSSICLLPALFSNAQYFCFLGQYCHSTRCLHSTVQDLSTSIQQQTYPPQRLRFKHK